MADFLGMDGHVYREVDCGGYDTEAAARAACIARGATLYKEKMQGAFYLLPDHRLLRVTARGWAHGYVVRETVRVDV